MNDQLRDFFLAKGPWAALGHYTHTYPGKEDTLHEAALALEKEGVLTRHFTKPGHVCWVPVRKVAEPESGLTCEWKRGSGCGKPGPCLAPRCFTKVRK